MNLKRILTLALALLMFSVSAMAVTDPLANEPGVLPIAKEPIKLSIGLTQSEYVLDYYKNFQTRLYEENAGIELEFEIFPAADAGQKLKMMVSSGAKLPDILTFGIDNNNDRYLYGEAGALIALDEYFDRDTGLAAIYYARCEEVGLDADEMLNLSTSPDGHIYGMPTYTFALSNRYNNRAWINQTWLDTLGLDAPTTIDELTAVLIAFRDGDPNGNGIRDEIPMSGAAGWTGNANPVCWLQNMFIYCDMTKNRYLSLDMTDGVLDVSYDKDEYRDFLQYINMLIAEELLDPACFTQSVSEMRAQLQAETETIGMMFGSANGFGKNIASWQPLEQPVGADGKRTVTTSFSDFFTKTSISSDCEHPEIAFLFCMMGYMGDEYVITARFGEYGVDWVYSTDPNAKSLFEEMGVKPNIREINGVWCVLTDKNWQGISLPGLYSENTITGEFDGNELYGERLHGRSVCMNYKYAPDYKDIVKMIVYTAEESDRWSEIRTSLTTYIQESTALFAIGQLDPANDVDWDAYLAELNKLCYQDLLEVDNAAFARMSSAD